MKEFVILVDENDQEIGQMEKLEAHEKAALHRAFSILLFNDKNELLLQQRALTKYHSPGLWTNTCCSHPRPQENIEEACSRRLQEELGMSAEMEFLYKFQYKTAFENGLAEHELDYVFIGKVSSTPQLNPEEVMAIQYLSLGDINTEISVQPKKYTFWFKEIMKHLDTEKIYQKLNEQ